MGLSAGDRHDHRCFDSTVPADWSSILSPRRSGAAVPAVNRRWPPGSFTRQRILARFEVSAAGRARQHPTGQQIPTMRLVCGGSVVPRFRGPIAVGPVSESFVHTSGQVVIDDPERRHLPPNPGLFGTADLAGPGQHRLGATFGVDCKIVRVTPTPGAHFQNLKTRSLLSPTGV